jgi:hypothetical protein
MYQSCVTYSCNNGAVTLHNQVILDFTIDIKHRDQVQHFVLLLLLLLHVACCCVLVKRAVNIRQVFGLTVIE